jgi:hypothetical protein
VSRLLQRAALVGLGGYLLSLVLVASYVVRHPEAFIHVTPLQGFGIEATFEVISFVGITAGAAVGLFLVRSRLARLPAIWLIACGAFVVFLARLLPSIPAILGACPISEVCNPYHWSVSMEWFRLPLLALVATAILATFASSNAGTPPNKSLERTREG